MGSRSQVLWHTTSYNLDKGVEKGKVLLLLLLLIGVLGAKSYGIQLPTILIKEGKKGKVSSLLLLLIGVLGAKSYYDIQLARILIIIIIIDRGSRSQVIWHTIDKGVEKYHHHPPTAYN